jgi:hypothetical protein
MKNLTFAAILAILPGLASAGALEDSMKAFVDKEVRQKLADPMVIAALKGANASSSRSTASGGQRSARTAH